MTIFFEVFLLVGFSLASLYIGYRYSIDFSQKEDQPYNPIGDDLENNKRNTIISKTQYAARQKELDKLYIQIKEAKQRQKKTLAEIDLLKTKSKTKNSKPISDQDFNNLLVE